MSYNIHAYGNMMVDPLRKEPYFEALRRAVKPGSVVVDVGTGTGLHALLAAQLGARRVIAIEPSGAIETGRAIAKANGLEDRIEFIRAASQTVELDERADVVVSDLRGRLPLLRANQAALQDARRRFLAPGGIFIPACDDLVVAAFENQALYEKVVSPWDDNPLGLDMSPGRELVVNQLHTGQVELDHLLTGSAPWATIDYSADLASGAQGTVTLPVARAGKMHGLALWFEATLMEGIGYSTGPGTAASVYGRVIVTLLRPIDVIEGDTLEIGLRADLAGEDYVWTWRTLALDAQRRTKASFEQSTFLSWPLSKGMLARRRTDRIVELNDAGRVCRSVLNALDQGTTLGESANLIQAQFPNAFPSPGAALARAADLADEFSD